MKQPLHPKSILESRGLRPLKQLGQNFLHDPNLCQAIADALPVEGVGPVLEIGPGLGALTRALLNRGLKVIAIEIDSGLQAYLKETFASQTNFRLIEGDAVDLIPQTTHCPFLAGNLPYNISTPLLMLLPCLKDIPLCCVFTVQKEMANRFIAEPSTKDYNAASVFLQTYYFIEPVRTIKPKLFYPEPKVESTVIRLTRKKDKHPPNADRIAFRQFLRSAFSQRRKKLCNVLPVEDKRRPEEIPLDQWHSLFDEYRRHI